jgi:hypothetical protein
VGGKFVGRVDLADLSLRIVLEADSMEFHGLPELMEKDCKRYDELVADDWLVLRFSWMQVMAKHAWVADVMARTVRLRQGQQLRRSASGQPPGEGGGLPGRAPNRYQAASAADPVRSKSCSPGAPAEPPWSSFGPASDSCAPRGETGRTRC